MNLVQSLVSAALKPEKPLHVGEVMSLWSLLTTLHEGRSVFEGLLHHTADPELKPFITQFVSEFDEPWTKRIKEFMLKQGIPLPAPGADKPEANPSEIPPGARFTDPEIAMLLVAKFRASIQLIQHATLECLRYDLGALLLEMQAAFLRQAAVLRE